MSFGHKMPCVWFLEFFLFYLSVPNFSLNLWTFFQLFNAADWCKELTIFTRNDYFSIPSISCSVDIWRNLWIFVWCRKCMFALWFCGNVVTLIEVSSAISWAFLFWSELKVVKLVKGKSDHQYDFTWLTSSNRSLLQEFFRHRGYF